DELHAVLQGLREVANEIYPPLLDTAGLGAALEAVAERHGMPMTVHAPEQRTAIGVEAAAYFAVADQLSALAGRCSAASLDVRRTGGQLVLRLKPEPGGAASTAADGQADREPERGVITVRVPCEWRS